NSCVMVAGVPVSRNDDVTEEKLASFLQDNEHLFQSVLHPEMPALVTMKLLRACAGPRINYLCRTLPPSLMEDIGKDFDNKIIQTFIDKLKLERVWNNTASEVARLSARLGGLGLRPYGHCNQAYVGGVANAVHS